MFDEDLVPAEKERNLRPTEELAEACLAMSQLAQLRNETWRRCGHWEPDWTENYYKYCIGYERDEVFVFKSNFQQSFLSFKTIEIAQEFLEKHKRIIEIAKPLL